MFEINWDFLAMKDNTYIKYQDMSTKISIYEKTISVFVFPTVNW